MTEEAAIVFEEMCKFSQNWEGSYVFSSKLLANSAGMPRYKAIKALHELRDQGLIKRDSEGCPAVVTCGEIVELVCEARPPLNGWSVTEEGRKTEVYSQAYKEYCKGLEDWANGAYDDLELESEVLY